MLAAVLRDFNQLELEELPVPEPGPGEVLVRIRSCGFCATDYKAIKGIRRNVSFPLIPGHEPAGVVAAVGPLVSNVKEGDEVIIQPSGYCGLCRSCRLGMTHYCERAYTTGGDGPDDVRPGSFAEYTVTGANTLYHKPATISFDAACQTEPVSGAWKGLIQMSQLQVGDDVVVIGTGGIGAYCLMVAKAAGAGTLIAVDMSDYALETARKLGATHLLNPRTCDVKAAIAEILPHGPDLVLEAAGPIDAVKLMVSLLRRGTRWNIFGITTHEPFELDGGLMHFLEARMDASFGTTPLAMEKSIRLMERGLVNPEQVITHRFPLAKLHDAVAAMGSGEKNKVIVNP
ncbi:MAG: Threonine dehydrogenase and related Zn-dependent dehydrogenase [Armatimonadetes bacterium]|jgi:threonine dehydrogenase-like Zn-dependent dehydrogenase|nr:Threonine dehydrogenase and related Zn-dependent dehydrogenase [Armatimonadota bacterium]